MELDQQQIKTALEMKHLHTEYNGQVAALQGRLQAVLDQAETRQNDLVTKDRQMAYYLEQGSIVEKGEYEV